ncbi:unnamed protein product, partial [Dibothriocephalus latus]
MTSSALNLPAIPNTEETAGLNYSTSPNENILPGSNDVLKTDGDGPTRISLPLNYSNCEPYSLSTAGQPTAKDTYLQATDASSNLKKMRSKQSVPKYLTQLSGMTNGHAEPNATEAFPLDKTEEALTLAATMPLGGTTFTFPTALPQHSAGLNLSMANSLESYHSSKYTKSPMDAAYAGLGLSAASTMSSLNGQQASSQLAGGGQQFAASRVGSPASAAAALAAAS